ncbi:hypothetical protein BDA99DRAFT_563869 [Phascolomyces articulosus]|uniref:Uncharacterized protein n=1 Tax=Phascolomyces articulosus TaxID=60185 RepID=A0AAD5PA05_9FUNG|nr:hypothetical protein BDA99DRAFT_563869 [Phascolomyces articulosus]
MKVPGVIGLNKKPFKYPTSTMARGTSLTQENATVHTECVFAHESLMITETDDITKRVSVKVLRLPEPPKLTPLRFPSQLQRRATIRGRGNKNRPALETRRRVQQKQQRINMTTQETNNNNNLKLAPLQKEEQQQQINDIPPPPLPIITNGSRCKQCLQCNKNKDENDDNDDDDEEEEEDRKSICNISNLSTTTTMTNMSTTSSSIHSPHPDSDIFMPAVAQALLNERSNNRFLNAPVLLKKSSPSLLSSSCSYNSSSSLSTSCTTTPPPPPSLAPTPPPPSIKEQQQRNYHKRFGTMMRWISSRLFFRNMKKDYHRCSPLTYLHSNHLYKPQNSSCPTIVALDKHENKYKKEEEKEDDFLLLKRPSPMFFDSTITL